MSVRVRTALVVQLYAVRFLKNKIMARELVRYVESFSLGIESRSIREDCAQRQFVCKVEAERLCVEDGAVENP